MFDLLVALSYVMFCHVSLVGSSLEVIASFRNCQIVFHFQLPVACESPLELAAR